MINTLQRTRHLPLALLLTFAMAQGALAQSVSIPMDDDGSAVTEQAPPRVHPPAAPQRERAQSNVTPNNQRMRNLNNHSATHSAAPRLNNSAAPKGELPAIPGVTPSQVRDLDTIIKQLSAVNPAFAKNNPIVRYDNITKNQEDSRKIAKSIRDACGLKYFNVQLPTLTPNERNNLRRYGATAIAGAIGTLCHDPDTKSQIENNFGMLNIATKAGLTAPQVKAESMSITLTYDFNLTDPPPAGLIVAQFKQNLNTLQKNMDTQKQRVSAPGYDQDNMESEMDAIVKQAIKDARTKANQ